LINALYFITDASLTKRDNIRDCEIAAKAGVSTIQYRQKSGNWESRLQEAQQIRQICHKYNSTFIINDDLELAIACDADGIHIGQDDIEVATVRQQTKKGFIVGLSTHSLAQVEIANREAVDYIGFGPVFTTSTKNNAGDALGVELLQKAVKLATVPVVAIGGIKCSDIPMLIDTNCQAMAIISDILTDNNLEKRIYDVLSFFNGSKN
jgi:thiamine-phosphate pyrophosphorylase